MAQTTLIGEGPPAKKERNTAEKLAEKQQSISISEFFTKNRHLLGFDSPRKALLTAVKEAVDNSLDACQEMKVLPEIKVILEDIGQERYKITIEDNGPGIVQKQIPNIFAKLLYGSKFHRLRQSRGQQGIGISAAALYGQLTTGKPIRIISKTGPKNKAHYCELHLNTKTNEPEITADEEREWEGKDHGTKVQLELEGKYQQGKLSVDEFLQLTAISNPEATIIYKSPIADPVEFSRASTELPREAKEIQPHPYGVELGTLMKMLRETKANSLQSFLQQDFCRVSASVAKEICEKAKLNEREKPINIARQDVEKIFNAIKEVKIMAPPTDCLSPIGEEQMLKGLQKEINAEFYAAVTRSPVVYRGFPFQLECCTGDSKILLEDGSITNIKSFVEGKISQKVLAMDNHLKIRPVKVIAWHKFLNKHKILKIKTKSGRELQLTDNNQLPIIENGEIIWKETKDVMAGDYVACPRIYNLNGAIPHILELLEPEYIQVVDDLLVKKVLHRLIELFGTIKKISLRLNMNYELLKGMNKNKPTRRPHLDLFLKMIKEADLGKDLIYSIKEIRYVENNLKNPQKIKVSPISEDILYLLGLMNSDGHLSKHEMSFVNTDEHLHYLFSSKMKQHFGLTTRKKGTSTLICNKTLYELFKRLEKTLPQLPDTLLVAWLKGIVDGDGWVCLDDRRISQVGIATAKREKAEITQTILLRLGILSKIEKRNPSTSVGYINGHKIVSLYPQYNILIKDSENISKFATLISFRQLERSHKISKGILLNLNNSRDSVPIGSLLRNLREENGLFQTEMGFSDQSVRQIEKQKQNLSRGNLQILLQKRDYNGLAYQKLRTLAYSDLIWDKIIDIELVENQEFVYDLTTEVGNFVANNIIMHNCAIAYGGSLPKDDLAKVIRYANRVPLQHQAGACALTKSVLQTAWKNYGLSQSRGSLPVGPLIIMVHMASVWVPFTSESKEAVASYDEIMKEVKLALQDAGRKLASYIRKNIKAKEQQERVDLFEKYIPELAGALATLTGEDKIKLQKELEEILKKGLKDLLADVKAAEKEEIKGKNIVFSGQEESEDE